MRQKIYTHDPKKRKAVLSGIYDTILKTFYKKVNDDHYMIKEKGYGIQDDIVEELKNLGCEYIVIKTKKYTYKFKYKILERKSPKDYGYGKQRFLKVKERIKDTSSIKCDKCSLYKTSKAGKYSCVKLMGEGNTETDIMLVGEAPGYNEIVKQKLHASKAGITLIESLKAVGINKEDIYITNIVKCRPPKNRPPTDSEIKACSEYLEDEIRSLQPKVIGVLGNSPLSYFLNKKGVTKLRGLEVWSEKYNCWILPIYHPSYVMRFAKKAKQYNEFKHDLGKLTTLIDKKRIKKKTIYKKIDTIEKVKKLIDGLLKQKEVAFDLETDRLEYYNNTILCCSFSCKEATAFYLPFEDSRFWNKEEIEIIRKELKRFFESDVKKIAQNGKFDNKHLLSKGIKVNNYYFDTMLAHYLLDEEGSHSLSNLSITYTNMGNYKDKLRDYIRGKIKVPYKKEIEVKKTLFKRTETITKNKKSTIWDAPLEDLIEYSCKDSDATFRVYKKLKKLLVEENLDNLFYKIVMPVSRVLEMMEFRGITADKNYIARIASRFRSKIKHFESEIQQNKYIKESAERLKQKKLNINSPLQLRTLLFDVLNLEPIRYSHLSKEPSTDKTTLEELNSKNKIKILEDILNYRKIQKFYSTYIEAYEKIANHSIDNKVHTTYLLSRTKTGRLSSQNPNLQNIPKRDEGAKIIRKALTAQEGFTLVECDYKQLEFRIFAHCVNSNKLISMVKQVDIHRSIASKIFKIPEEKITKQQRSLAKGAVFGGIMYGGGSNILVRSFGISYKEADKILNEFFDEFPKSKDYIEDQIKLLKENQYVVNLFGRKRRISDIFHSDEQKRKAAKRQAVNAVIQSSAADIVYVAMNKLFNQIDDKNDSRILLNIHDAVIFEIRDNILDSKINQIINIMNNPVKLRVPIIVDCEYGKNLGEMEQFLKK